MAEEDVRRLAEEAVREGATEIELAGKDLTGSPRQIRQLFHLQILLIHDNRLRPAHGRQGCPPHFSMVKLERQVSDEPWAREFGNNRATQRSPCGRIVTDRYS